MPINRMPSLYECKLITVNGEVRDKIEMVAPKMKYVVNLLSHRFDIKIGDKWEIKKVRTIRKHELPSYQENS